MGEGTLFPANLAVCPNCNTTFSHNKINGIALVAAAADIDTRKRMHLRLALDAIERHGNLDQPAFNAVKKVFFDAFNNYNRDVQTIIGLDDGAE